MDDEAGLVAAARAGDDLAFGELVRRHQRTAYRLAFAYLLDHDEADDAVQEAFLAAHAGLGTFRGGSPFGTWLARIVIRKALDRRRAARRRTWLPRLLARLGRSAEGGPLAEGAARGGEVPFLDLAPAGLVPAPPDAGGPEAAAERGRLLAALRAATAELGARQQEVFALHVLEGRSLAEVAALLGVTEGTVKQHLSRALVRVRARLAAYRNEG